MRTWLLLLLAIVAIALIVTGVTTPGLEFFALLGCLAAGIAVAYWLYGRDPMI
jgi:hypothetical protein